MIDRPGHCHRYLRPPPGPVARAAGNRTIRLPRLALSLSPSPSPSLHDRRHPPSPSPSPSCRQPLPAGRRQKVCQCAAALPQQCAGAWRLVQTLLPPTAGRCRCRRTPPCADPAAAVAQWADKWRGSLRCRARLALRLREGCDPAAECPPLLRRPSSLATSRGPPLALAAPTLLEC
jgi:hypothetical protein